MFKLTNPVIAAVRSDEDLARALKSPAEAVFMLKADINTLKSAIDSKCGKSVFVHIDMADGIGKDKKGVEYIASLGADGIITTKNQLIAAAKEYGLTAVQRFFIIDSHSVHTALEYLNVSKPDFAELMPGVIPRAIREFVEKSDIPIIAGGLIENKGDIINALSAGAYAVSAGKSELWYE